MSAEIDHRPCGADPAIRGESALGSGVGVAVEPPTVPNDVDLALALFPALHDDYANAASLQAALDDALRHYKRKLSEQEVETVLSAGLKTQPDSLSKSAAEGWRAIRDRVSEASEWAARRL